MDQQVFSHLTTLIHYNQMACLWTFIKLGVNLRWLKSNIHSMKRFSKLLLILLVNLLLPTCRILTSFRAARSIGSWTLCFEWYDSCQVRAFKTISNLWQLPTFEISSLANFRPTSFSLPGLSMLAKSVAPQKTSVPQAGSSLAFLSPFVPFVPEPGPNKAHLLISKHVCYSFLKRGMNQPFSAFLLLASILFSVYALEQFCLKTLQKMYVAFW